MLAMLPNTRIDPSDVDSVLAFVRAQVDAELDLDPSGLT